jgi:GTP cyclohydrolase I
MKDIQNMRDNRRIPIRKVGVKNISYPLTVLDREKKLQQTVAKVNMFVNLPHRFKGTHMSRFVEILNRFHNGLDLRSFRLILQKMKEKLEAEAAHLEIDFPYFLWENSQNEDTGYEHYQCRIHGSLEKKDDLVFEVTIPITIPHGDIPKDGLTRSPGHWGQARVAVRFHHFIWIEELINMVEQTLPSSCGVSELCQQIGNVLSDKPAINWFQVVVENFGHGYSTFASVSEDR